jgi:hypothetical protein
MEGYNVNVKSKATILKVLVFGLVACSIVGLTAGVHFSRANSNNNIPAVNYMHFSSIINPDDDAQLTGDADYVFVGKVLSAGDTVYKFPVDIETETGTKSVSSPYTNYSVAVLDNIKGSLITETIPLQKAGGLSEDGAEYFVYEADFLPAAGDICVFYAYAQPDGSLLVCGANSNKLISVPTTMSTNSNSVSLETAQTSLVYEEAVSAYENEQIRERTRFVSSYDATEK